ncbi:hypothetical protein J1605_004178 [Eschrichtius robustus]|uniref:Uncharacterized protein n=1 Tax=Eschrichtius robustus TaxID=9764 RepID=A0AB34HLC2_ESCRO|nr:hypothetical protein J1605_004178 [Eschrichtius robustus]
MAVLEQAGGRGGNSPCLPHCQQVPRELHTCDLCGPPCRRDNGGMRLAYALTDKHLWLRTPTGVGEGGIGSSLAFGRGGVYLNSGSSVEPRNTELGLGAASSLPGLSFSSPHGGVWTRGRSKDPQRYCGALSGETQLPPCTAASRGRGGGELSLARSAKYGSLNGERSWALVLPDTPVVSPQSPWKRVELRKGKDIQDAVGMHLTQDYGNSPGVVR